jgi:hypothetical protein|tara:strand:- start:115 stop:240 length:126 start_codon:yes stop_codon:yes gene_type:complete
LGFVEGYGGCGTHGIAFICELVFGVGAVDDDAFGDELVESG